MLEKPEVDEGKILATLRGEYHELRNIVQFTFLPLGADSRVAVYRAETQSGEAYFVKLRRNFLRDWFSDNALYVPRVLHDAFFMRQIISAIRPTTKTIPQHFSIKMDDFSLMAWPFIEGQNGFELSLTDVHRIELGAALKILHSARFPPSIANRLGNEHFSSNWRAQVRAFQRRANADFDYDPIALGLGELLRAKQTEIDTLVDTAERFAADLQSRDLPMVLTHGDIHGWNMLISNDGQFYIVDWDTLLLAPKERDLMFIGTGLGGLGHSIEDEIRLFYEGYGPTEIDRVALAYYRCERIVQDIASYCEQIFAVGNEDSEDRAVGLRSLTVQFEPGGVVEYALRSVEEA